MTVPAPIPTRDNRIHRMTVPSCAGGRHVRSREEVVHQRLSSVDGPARQAEAATGAEPGSGAARRRRVESPACRRRLNGTVSAPVPRRSRAIRPCRSRGARLAGSQSLTARSVTSLKPGSTSSAHAGCAVSRLHRLPTPEYDTAHRRREGSSYDSVPPDHPASRVIAAIPAR
jgi:hypothetical protein